MNMPNFVSQYMYSIPVKKRSKVEYYENITKVPCKFQGAFILDEAQSDREKIEFKIISPNNTVLFEKTDVASIFDLELKEKGLYTLVFNNKYYELDIYPFSEEYAILEIELNDINEEISLPNVEIIKEVTNDKKYRNYSIAQNLILQ